MSRIPIRANAVRLACGVALVLASGCQTVHMGTVPLVSRRPLALPQSKAKPVAVSGSACTTLIFQSESEPNNLQRAYEEALLKAGKPYNTLINVTVTPSGFSFGSENCYFFLQRCMKVIGTAIHVEKDGGAESPADGAEPTGDASGVEASSAPADPGVVMETSKRGTKSYVGGALLGVGAFPLVVSVVALVVGIPFLVLYGFGIVIWAFGLLNLVVGAALAGTGGVLLYLDRPQRVPAAVVNGETKPETIPGAETPAPTGKDAAGAPPQDAPPK